MGGGGGIFVRSEKLLSFQFLFGLLLPTQNNCPWVSEEAHLQPTVSETFPMKKESKGHLCAISYESKISISLVDVFLIGNLRYPSKPRFQIRKTCWFVHEPFSSVVPCLTTLVDDNNDDKDNYKHNRDNNSYQSSSAEAP